jgi:hypothetical protein
MKVLVCMLVLCTTMAGAWSQALLNPSRPQLVHPMVLGAVKPVTLPQDGLRPSGAAQSLSLPLYDATSPEQIAYDGRGVYIDNWPVGTILQEQIPLLGPARLDRLEILYVGGGGAGSTANITVRVYGCRSGWVGDDPLTQGFPLLYSLVNQSIPNDGSAYLLSLNLGGTVYSAGVDAANKPFAQDLVVQISFTGTTTPPLLFIANGANSLGLRNEGGYEQQKRSLYPLGAGDFWEDVGNRFHMERYFTGTSDNVWREGTAAYWWGGSPLGNWSISVLGSYNFVGVVSNNANVDMTEAKVQVNGHPVTVPLLPLPAETLAPQQNARAFTLPLTPNVQHDVRIAMGPPYLVRARTVTASSPATPVVEEFFLISGDLDGDNEVTLFDFGIFVQSFGEIGD